MWLAVLAVAAGGALGSVARYVISMWAMGRFPAFPFGTLAINLTGSFFIGIVYGLAASRGGMSPYLRVFLASGILGGYTTFSTFAFEAYSLGAQGDVGRGAAYVLTSVVVGVAAAYAGVLVARALP